MEDARGGREVRRLAIIAILVLLPLALWANPYRGEPSLVVIDAGHGGSDPGALGSAVQEKELTLSISLALADELAERGMATFLTRNDDSFLSLQERCGLANGSDFDIKGYPIFVSIHINSATNSEAEGFEVYVKTGDRRVAMLDEATSDKLALKYSSYTNAQLNAYKDIVSLSLADSICRAFGDTFPGIPMRGVKSGDFWVLNGTWMPSVLVEVGFISNPEEEERMATASFQEALASLIADAIEEL